MSNRTAKRKSSEERIDEIIGAAERRILKTGSLPLALNEISASIGTSRALIYTYFRDQDALVEAVLTRQFDMLDQAGLTKAVRSGSIDTIARNAALLYFEHVREHGPVITNILRELPTGAHISDNAVAFRDRVLRRLANAARRDLDLSATEAITLVEMLAAIPEELARLVRADRLDAGDARPLCAHLVSTGIASVRPTDRD